MPAPFKSYDPMLWGHQAKMRPKPLIGNASAVTCPFGKARVSERNDRPTSR